MFYLGVQGLGFRVEVRFRGVGIYPQAKIEFRAQCLETQSQPVGAAFLVN